MSKKIKEVSINKTDKLVSIPSTFPLDINTGDEIITIEVKPRLTLINNASFVKSIALGIINEDDCEVRYGFKEFTIRINTLEFYTNLRIPEDLDKQYDLAFNTDILDRILTEESFKLDEYNNLLRLADKQIEFEIQKMLSEFKAGTQAYIDKITAEAEQIISMFQSFGKVFENITPEQVAEILPNLAKFGNEKDLVKAFIDIKKEDEENALV